MPPIPDEPEPLKGEALRRRQEACIASHAFVLTGDGERYWTDEYVYAVCMVANPPIYEGPSRIL